MQGKGRDKQRWVGDGDGEGAPQRGDGNSLEHLVMDGMTSHALEALAICGLCVRDQRADSSFLCTWPETPPPGTRFRSGH